MKNINILVVCWGNIHRSPIAAHFINKKAKELGLEKSFTCVSRGIQGSGTASAPQFDNLLKYEKQYAAAMPSLKKYNIDLSQHKATPIDKAVLQNADLILAVDQIVLNDSENGLNSQYPEFNKKYHLITELIGENKSIEDLAHDINQNKYDALADMMHEVVEKGFENIEKLVERNLRLGKERK